MPSQNLSPSPDLALYLADTNLAAGIQYGLWVEKAPSTEEQVALSSMSQDKLGHARAMYKVTEKVTDRSSVELQYDRDPDAFAWNPAWVAPWPTWHHLVIAQALFGDALLMEIQHLDEASGYGDLLSKIDQEDVWHEKHATAWLASAGAMDQTGKMDAALEDLWPFAVAYFGIAGEDRFPDDVESGLLGRGDDALREAFIGRAVSRLREVGLNVPAKQEGDAWSLSPAPDASLRHDVTGRVAPNEVEIVSLLQDPDARALAELA